MENFGTIQFVIVIILSIVIVFLLSKMSSASHYRFTDHFRCSNDFYHVFGKEEIEYSYGKNKTIYLCPKSGCGGILKLYEIISDEEYKELQRLKYFDE